MRRARDALRLLRHAGSALTTALVLLELATAVVPLAIISVIGVVVGRVDSHASVGGVVGLLTFLLLLQQVIGPFRTVVAYRVARRVDGVIRAQVMELANTWVSIAPFEDPLVLDRLELAGGIIDPFWGATPGGAAAAVIALGGRYLQVVGAAVLLGRSSPPVALGLTAVVLFAYRRSREWNRVRLRAVRENQLGGRASRYTSGLASTPPPAKEVRLFGALDWLVARFRRQWDEVVSARLIPWRWAARRVTALVAGLAPVVVLAFVLVVRTGVESHVSARSLAVALQAGVALFSLLFDQRQDDASRLISYCRVRLRLLSSSRQGRGVAAWDRVQ